MTFRFAGAHAQVCKHCKFVVARTDRGLSAVGRMADLVELPSPLQVGATGRWNNEPFAVDGRVQLDRAGAPGAPWQEIFIAFPQSGRWVWVATAQGRYYATSEVELPQGGLPPMASLRPGQQIQLGQYGVFTVAEVGRRRVISGEGEMPHVAAPGVVTGFADIAGAGGAFGTIDYGDGRDIRPKLYLGKQFDPAEMRLDSGMPVQQPEAQVTSLACPNCGGNLPLVTPNTTERIVCRYCGTASDNAAGQLRPMGQAPRPPIEPYIPLGAEGTLRQMRVICIGFVIRGCVVEEEHYSWREYLIYAGPSVGYLWLMEEDGQWQLVSNIGPGDVLVSGSAATYRGNHYTFKQSVNAIVEFVVGEFYWKVEIGETVRATEYQGPGGKVSVEQAPTEVNYSFCEPIDAKEIQQAFNLSDKPVAGVNAGAGGGGSSVATIVIIIVVLLLLCFLCSFCGDGGGSGGGGGVIFIGGGGK